MSFVYRRRVPVQTGRGGPGANVRWRGPRSRRIVVSTIWPPECRQSGLSTAFDSVTSMARTPRATRHLRQGGQLGVSIATLDDAKKLYSGFDLRSHNVGFDDDQRAAPMILAFYMNAAIDQACEKHISENDPWAEVEARSTRSMGTAPDPSMPATFPKATTGWGRPLGGDRDQVLPADVYDRIRAETVSRVRGTVQADILKEDQAQNTCIFSTEFALGMMGDIQQWFVDNDVRNFYSVSISGYHMAEAEPTRSPNSRSLANGFTYVENYLARGMDIDDFAPNLFLLLQRHRRRVRRHRACRLVASGPRRSNTVTGATNDLRV